MHAAGGGRDWARGTGHWALSCTPEQPHSRYRRDSNANRTERTQPKPGVTGHGALGTGHLVKPRALPSNPHIAVLAISSPSEADRIEIAKQHLEARGARVTIAPNIAHSHRGYLAGPDDERVETLNRFLN